MLLAATGLPEVKAALAPVVGAIAPRGALGYVVLFGLLESARALPRAAQPLRRGHRRVHGARRTRDSAAGDARRRGDGRRASAERVRPHEHPKCLGRELHRRASRTSCYVLTLPYQVAVAHARDARGCRRRTRPLRPGGVAFRRTTRSGGAGVPGARVAAVGGAHLRRSRTPKTRSPRLRPRTCSAKSPTVGQASERLPFRRIPRPRTAARSPIVPCSARS